MKSLLLLLVIAMSVSTYSHGSELKKEVEKPDSYYEKIPVNECTERGFGHYEENRCLSAWMAKLNKQLDKAFNKWIADIDSEYKDLLSSQEQIDELKSKAKEAQIAWDSYRQKQCGLEADFVVGTGSGAEFGRCYILLTKERLKYLSGK